MTDREIQIEEDLLNNKYYGDKCRVKENELMPWSPEDEKRMEELRCREMVHSCLIYGTDPYKEGTHWVMGVGHVKQTWMTPYEERLGKQRVKEIVDEEKEEFKHATVLKNVHTDCEGVTYNAVVFDRDREECCP